MFSISKTGFFPSSKQEEEATLCPHAGQEKQIETSKAKLGTACFLESN